MRAALCLLVVCGAAASGNIVLNGSFEDPQQSGPTRADISVLTDWTASGGFMLLERGLNSTSNIEAHSGSQFVSMGHSGAIGDTLTQSFETTPGAVYQVSFATRSIQGLAFQAVLGEVIDDTSHARLGSVMAMELQIEDGWIRHMFSFEAVSDASTIRFVHAMGSVHANVAIDSVIVSIPAPAMLTALGLGIAFRRGR